MKRLLIRLSILSVVIALGCIAIAQARNGLERARQNDIEAAEAELPTGAPGPIELKSSGGLAAEPNPLRRPSDLAEPGLPSRLGHLPKSRAIPQDGDEIPSAEVVLTKQPRNVPQRSATPPIAGDRYAITPPADASAANNEPPHTVVASDMEDGAAPRARLAAHNEPAATSRYQTTPPSADDDIPAAGPSGFEGPANPPRELREPGRLDPPRRPPADDDIPGAAISGAAIPAARPLRPRSGANSPPRESTANSNTASSPASNDPNPLREASDSMPELAPPNQYPEEAPAERAPIRAANARGAGSSSNAAPRSIKPTTSEADHDAAPITGNGPGRPGAKSLEGAQSPGLSLLKTAPEEIQVGKKCTFEILVDVGSVAAEHVEVHDVVPQGTNLVSTSPKAEVSGQGEIVWQLGRLEPGAETKLEMLLLPTHEGEVGSVATVRFAAQASARTIATRPQLALEVTAAPTVMIGEEIKVGIKLSNPGTGAATGVMLLEEIPAGVKHPAGASLEYEVGTLAPGESREMELVLTADQAGRVANIVVAQGEGNLQTEAQADFEIIAPKLAVNLKGPKKRYLERPATYNISVSNPGTAAAQQIELTTYLPQGMKFVKANNAGTYDPETHSVSWGLEELPAKQSGSVELVAVPVEAGEQNLRVEGRASRGLTDQAQQSVDVEGVAAVLFTVADANDPVEVGGETDYEIKVVNQGSKASTNVQIVVLLPPGIEAVSATGPTRHVIEDGRVVFSPLQKLAPKADTTYQIKMQANAKGDHRIRVQLQTDEMQTPVTKEESTRVYADE